MEASFFDLPPVLQDLNQKYHTQRFQLSFNAETINNYLKLRVLLVFILSLLFGSLLSQSNEFLITGRFKIDGSSNNDAQIILEKDGRKVKTLPGDARLEIGLDYQAIYIISFEKEGFVSKKLRFDTHVPQDRIEYGFMPFDFTIEIFEQFDEVNTVMFNQPVGKIAFSDVVDEFDYDTDYTQSIQAKMEEVMEEVEVQKEEKAKRIEEEEKKNAELNKKVDNLTSVAQKSLNSGNPEEAIQKLQVTLQLKDNPEIKTKLANAQKELKAKEQAAIAATEAEAKAAAEAEAAAAAQAQKEAEEKAAAEAQAKAEEEAKAAAKTAQEAEEKAAAEAKAQAEAEEKAAAEAKAQAEAEEKAAAKAQAKAEEEAKAAAKAAKEAEEKAAAEAEEKAAAESKVAAKTSKEEEKRLKDEAEQRARELAEKQKAEDLAANAEAERAREAENAAKSKEDARIDEEERQRLELQNKISDAITNGDALLAAGKLGGALDEYNKAKMLGADSEVDQKILTVKDLIEKQEEEKRKAKEAAQAISNGPRESDQLAALIDEEAAKQNVNKGSSKKPDIDSKPAAMSNINPSIEMDEKPAFVALGDAVVVSEPRVGKAAMSSPGAQLNEDDKYDSVLKQVEAQEIQMEEERQQSLLKKNYPRRKTVETEKAGTSTITYVYINRGDYVNVYKKVEHNWGGVFFFIDERPTNQRFWEHETQ